MKIFILILLTALSSVAQVTIPAGITPFFGPTNAPDILFTNASKTMIKVAVYDCDPLAFEARVTTNRDTTIAAIGSDSTPVITLTTNYPGFVERKTIPAMSCGTFPARRFRRGCIVISTGEFTAGFAQ